MSTEPGAGHTDVTQLTRNATNIILDGAREKDLSIQNFSDLDRYLFEHPWDDGYILELYRSTGYLDLWRVERGKNPWQYDLRILNREPATPRQIAEYCRSTLLEQMPGSNRYIQNHAGYTIYAARSGLMTFITLRDLYETLASLHEQRVQVAAKWLQATGRAPVVLPFGLNIAIPNSLEWVAALERWNPVQAEHVKTILRLAARDDVCCMCGDEHANICKLIQYPAPPSGITTYRLCVDCERIRLEEGQMFTRCFWNA